SPLREAVAAAGAVDWLQDRIGGSEEPEDVLAAADAFARACAARNVGVEVLLEAARVWGRGAYEAAAAHWDRDDLVRLLDGVLPAVVSTWAAAYAGAPGAPAAAGAPDILQRVIDLIPYGIAVYAAPDLVLQQINQFGRDFLPEPLRAGSPVGRPLAELLSGPAYRSLVETFRRVVETREPAVIREAALQEGERTAYCNWIVLPVVDEDGRVQAVVHVIDDVTQDVESRRRLERLARESELQRAELEAVFASMADGVIIVDRAGNLVQANEAATRILGLDREALRAALRDGTGWELRDAQGNPLERDQTPAGRAVGTGEPVLNQEVVVQAGRREIIISASAAPVRDREGAVTGAVVVFHDVTPQKRAQEEQVRMERLRAVGEMASGVAHDFNNLLSLVLGRVELLREEVRRGRVDPGAVEAALASIEQAAMDGAETVRRLQDFTRSQRAREGYESVDVNQVVRDAVALSRPRWRDAPQQEGRTIACELELDPAAPPARGHASELREVLINLIFNAVDAMPEGGTLRLSTGREGDHARIAVSDTGVGMSREVKRRLFEPFFTTKGTSGGGMGLSISYGIISQYGGKILVDTAKGKGSTFTILLPVAEERPAAEAEAAAAPARAKVLAVDDEPGVLQALKLILNADGHQVTACSSGAEALEAAAREEFDLVFTDLGMPGMSGWEVARRIKEIRPKTPVALVTGWGVALDEERLRGSGVDLVINKPFRMAALRQAVAEAMMLRDKL
ncbi:MAG TPA: response regulator, partial [Dehalococcoidia bacterium]